MLVSDPQEIAELLKCHYNSMFSTPVVSQRFAEPLDKESSTSDPKDTLSDILIDPSGVRSVITSLSNNGAVGPDRIPTRCYKWGGDFMVDSMKDIYRVSTGVVDVIMKEALITPI
jgi:hypothetical protein